MAITYLLNGVDITNLVYSKPTLSKKVGRGTQLATNNLQIQVVNDKYGFSVENEDSLIYDFRGDYSEIVIEIKDGDVVIWKGVLDNVSRKEDGTVVLMCVESIINILSVDSFIYYIGDGYVGDMAYAGDNKTPAEHQLAILRRFLNDDNIDLASFKTLKEYQTTNTILGSCQVKESDNKSPLSFLQDLLLNMGCLSIKNDKVGVKLFESFLGDYGVVLSDDQIIDKDTIQKEKYSDPYFSYSIIYDNIGTPTTVEGSAGDAGTSDDTTSTTLTDSSKEWVVNQWKDNYIFVGDPSLKEIMKITGNNKTQIFFKDCTKSGAQVYTIVENNKIYEADYSDFPIKITSGAATIGTLVITKSPQAKLELSIELIDWMGLDVGDTITINDSNEGLVYQPFEITELKKELYSNIVNIVCIDKILYPILEDYQIATLPAPTGLTGYRVEADGSAYLSWDAVPGAAYYKVYYGTTTPTYSLQTTDVTNVHIIDHLEKWLGYYFWVVAVNFLGMEGTRSESLFLDKIVQSSGYIDGSLGYLYEVFRDWGYLEDYYYLITYKNIAYSDIGFLLKSPFVILDKSQANFSEEITQVYADSEASQHWGDKYRRVGYIDGAGSSSYLPEFVNNAGVMQIKNPLSKKLTLMLGGVKTVINPGATIPDSEDWFLKDSDGNYCTYWFQTGYMFDIHNTDQNEWFRVFKINQAMGVWEYGSGVLTVNDDTKVGTITHSSKSWIAGQWVNYYIGLVTTTSPLTIEWFKITANTATTLIFDFDGIPSLAQKYIINNEPYLGFHGLIVDDVWTSIYNEGVNLSNDDSNTTSNSSTSTVLTDSSKSWTIDAWIGYYVSIAGGPLLLITDNTATTLTFSGNSNPGTGQAYHIYEKYYNNTGLFYWQAMAEFLEMLVAHVENNSYGIYDNWTKVEKGIIVINTWPDRWEAYPYFVAAVNKRYRHFLMFEALQSTWNMANEVTKQFVVLDWHEVVERWDLMKISAGVGYARLAILGYPTHQQMMISHIAGSLMMSRYDGMIEDITSAGNIVLDQLYYDMLMAGNHETTMTVGIPSTGYEDSYIQNQYDRYGIMVRKFEGAYIFYNPSRQIKSVEYTFDEDVADYHTGRVFYYGAPYDLILAPRSASIFFKASLIGEDAYNFLRNYAPYSYVDYNTCWVVFTEAGEAEIGHNSVWLTNGYTNNKRFVLDGSQSIPVGVIEELFHAGDGSDTAVVGHDPLTEVVVGTGAETYLLLISLTILFVVKVESGGGTSWIVEDSGTDADGYAGEDWLEDYSKSWTPGEWAGKYVRIEGGDPIEIIDNSENELWFDYPYSPEGSVNYEIGHSNYVEGEVLTPNTDYLIEHKEWDISPTGKGKWKTYIHLITSQVGKDLTVSYYEQGVAVDGWPKVIASGEQVEHGICYRKKTGFALKTGAVNQSGATTTLVEGTDYYIMPELVRWKWDYRINPFGPFQIETTFDAVINLNSIYAVGGDQEIKGIHWGNIDPENAILVNTIEDTDRSIHGKKADYTSATIRRPRVLLYGFSKVVREDDLTPVAPADREADVFLFENQMKKYLGIYYDAVTITGDWDGIIETGSALGAWGSIDGILADPASGFDTWQEIADYFDVIILNDTFLEYVAEGTIFDSNTSCTSLTDTTLTDSSKSWTVNQWVNHYVVIAGVALLITANTATTLTFLYNEVTGTPAYSIQRSISGCLQWSSWLKKNDYNLIKNFKKRARDAGRNTLLIDRRSAAPSFVWWGGVELVNNILLNKGAQLVPGTTYYSDLTNVFGCYTYAGIDLSEITNINANIYIKTIADTYAKFPTSLTTDFRVGKIVDVTQQYIFDEEDEDTHPFFNLWENGGTWISYIPKTEAGREYFAEADILFEKSKMFLMWKDLTSLVAGEDNFLKYEEQGLNNILLRREPLVAMHYYDYFNAGQSGSYTYGRNYTVGAIAYPSPMMSDTGKYRAISFFHWTSALKSFLTSKYLFLLESTSDDFKSFFTFSSAAWTGYFGNYISDVAEDLSPWSGWWTEWWADKNAWGWALYAPFDVAELDMWGRWFPSDTAVEWEDPLWFDTWCDEVQDVYKLSKSQNSAAPMSFQRSGIAPMEGNVLSVVANGDGTATVYVDFDISSIDLGTPIATGVITDGKFDAVNWDWYYFSTNIDMRPYRGKGYYCHITTLTGISVLYIDKRDRTTSYTYIGDNAFSNKYGYYVDPDLFNGYPFAIRPTTATKAYKIALFQMTSDNNVVWNGSLLSKDNTARSFTFYLSRAVDQPAAGGKIIIYQGEDDYGIIGEGGDTKVQVGNRDVLGGRVLGIDDIIGVNIATTFRTDGDVYLAMPRNTLENMAPQNKPASMKHYEWAYAPLIKEFGYEKNTGLITCQEFFAHGATNRPPVLIWPGISEQDTEEIINRLIGTTITFEDLHAMEGDTIYLYYNSFNDMLRIKSVDVENAIDGYYKFGSLRSDDLTLLKALVENYIEEES